MKKTKSKRILSRQLAVELKPKELGLTTAGHLIPQASTLLATGPDYSEDS